MKTLFDRLSDENKKTLNEMLDDTHLSKSIEAEYVIKTLNSYSCINELTILQADVIISVLYEEDKDKDFKDIYSIFD
jgi:hypothetical protein